MSMTAARDNLRAARCSICVIERRVRSDALSGGEEDALEAPEAQETTLNTQTS